MIWSDSGTQGIHGLAIGAASDAKRYLRDAAQEIHSRLLQDGALVIRGVEHCTDPGMFEQTMETLGFETRDYVGGSSPRSAIRGKVMEATRTPPDWSVILHQEMAYVKRPPEVIAFVCVAPAGKGGESVIGDMRKVLQRVDPTTLEHLTERGLKLRRTLPCEARVQLKPGVKKSWQETFATSSAAQVEALCRSRGWDFEWNGADLVLWQDCISPLRQHPLKAEDIWCNQAHFWGPAAMLEWARIDGREQDVRELLEARERSPELLEAMCYGDGEPLPDDLILELFHLVRSLERDIDLAQGDILLLDNLQFAHGRRAFSGNRQINVLIANWADGQSNAIQG
ncbi:TauD/TfdA family dioxygenase [Pseudomonas sp. MSSRFD41]|nr:TauD/TfdA family dioxygenase [Pseudomonas sp. MSSRFD41]